MTRPAHIEPLYIVGEALGLPLACFDSSGAAIFSTSALIAEIGAEPGDLRELAAAIERDPESRAGLIERIGALAEPGGRCSARTCALGKDGAPRPLELNAVAVGVPGSSAAVVCVHEPAVDAALMARVELLERRASVGYAAAGAAHEFNNLLTAMLGWAQIALKAVGPESTAAPAISTIENSARRAKQIVGELLSSARPTSSAVQDVDVERLAAEALRLLSWELNAAHVDVETEIGDAGIVCGDSTRLLQVFVNVIRNAVEAMPARGKLRLRAAREDGRTVVEITDNGHGMTKEILGSAFEPFFTTKVLGASSTGGSGLGLPICRRIVEEHGGEIELRSHRPGGTTVRISFPGCRGASVVPRSCDPSRSSIPPGARLLVVDDEPDICEMIRTSLELHGAEVAFALTGADAFRRCKSERFDAAFVDFSMAGLSGFALGRALGELQPEMRIVFMSGVEIPQDPDPRFHHFLKKPFDLREIRCKLHDVLAPE
jgi:signal transduction histidine kinase/CheY-like chemotaxis protein